MQNLVPIRVGAAVGQESFSSVGDYVRHVRQYGAQAVRHNRTRWEGLVSLTAAFGDLAMILIGFCSALWLRNQSGLILPIEAKINILNYWRLVLFGTIVIF